MMTSKEALDELSLMINREKHINSEWNKKINDLKQTIKQDLERKEELEQELNEINFRIDQVCALNDIISEKNEQLEKENQKLEQDVKDVLEDYKDTATIMFKLDKAIEILKDKPYVLTIGLKEFQWREEENSYVYVEEKWIDTYDYDYDNELVESVDLIHEYYYLTKEEYELLNEVLGDE